MRKRGEPERWMCVRCGMNDRAGGTFLCQPCRNNPDTSAEMGRASERQSLLSLGWAGGWSHRQPEPDDEIVVRKVRRAK